MRGWGEVVGVGVRSPEHRVLQGRAWAQPLPRAGLRNPTVPRLLLHRGGRWSARGHNSQSKPHVSRPRYGGESKTSGTRRKHALAGSAGGKKRVLGFQDVWLLLLHINNDRKHRQAPN